MNTSRHIHGIILLAFSLLLGCTDNKQRGLSNNDSQTETQYPTEESVEEAIVAEPVAIYEYKAYDLPCRDSITLQIDKNGNIEFCDVIEGMNINAVIKPDTAYSEDVGHITYFLKGREATDTISTTYNQFFSMFSDLPVDTYTLCKDYFYTDLNDPNAIPFKFVDLNFDGVNEFLIVHRGYNRRYYEVYMKDNTNRYKACDYPPYNKLVSGHEADIVMDDSKKTIEITEHIGCCKSIIELYQLQTDKNFLCLSRDEIEMIGPDSTRYTTWKNVNGKLVQTEKYIETSK